MLILFIIFTDIVASDPAVDNSTRFIYTRKEVFLSDVIMTLWTNFAKSGYALGSISSLCHHSIAEHTYKSV